jgi:hypothetical protein
VAQLLERGALSDGTELDYAFALVHGEYRGRPTLDHAGAFMGFRAHFLRLPDEGVSVVALCNLASADPDRRVRQVADIVLADRFPEPEAPAREDAAPAFVSLPEEVLERHRGGYRDRKDQTVVKIAVDSGGLVVTGAPDPLKLSPLSETRFREVDAPAPRELEFGGDEADLRLFRHGRLQRTFDAVELVDPTVDDLRGYEGRYFSEELAATYTLTLEEGALSLQRGRLEPVVLEPTARHELQVEDLRLVFGRPGPEGPETLTVHAGRVRNVRFQRVRD